jgi:DNA repair exonuclease SbcCD ATPase subunit
LAENQVVTDKREAARVRLSQIESIRTQYNKHFETLRKHLGHWYDMLTGLASLQDEIRSERVARQKEIEERLNQFSNEKEMEISVQLIPDGDKRKFVEFLSDAGVGFFSRSEHGNYRKERLPERLSRVANPPDVSYAILSGDAKRLEKKATNGNEVMEIDEITAVKITKALWPYGHDDDAEVKTLDWGKMRIALLSGLIPWDDEICIMLKGRPVEHMSPGQRSSAMLPLIALAAQSPLVIDQPEDNLDNKMVGKVLIDLLANLKEKRQIIVATHNANIVVSGDAEQVIVLEARSDKEGYCAYSGSIDKSEIVDSVITIMEGGREAFEARSNRYGIPSGALHD